MRYGITLAVVVAVPVFLFVRGFLDEKRKRRAFRKQLMEACGKPPAGYEDRRRSGLWSGRGPAGRPDGYLRTIRDRFVIDEITWRELDMDDIFLRMDYTWSRAGEEYLYGVLHCPAENEREADRWEKAAAYFGSHAGERAAIQELLAQIGKERGMCFHDCLSAMQRDGKLSAAREYAADGAYVLAALLAGWDAAAGFFVFTMVLLYQIVTYFRERARLLPYLKSVAELLRVARGMDKLRRMLDPGVRGEIEQELQISLADCAGKLRGLKRHSFWVLQCGSAGSSPVSMLGDYVRILFHPDVIQFMTLKKKIAALDGELRAAYACIGYVDSAVSIAMYRASLERFCIPELYRTADRPDGGREDGLYMAEGVHPLLERAVANSISVSGGKGVLVTGSNASGKSTFLKTTAVNLLLAQTIHTVPARRFSAPFCRIYTAMQANDDIRKGESSYMAEILSLKRILDAGKTGDLPVFCFVDEILRGTNTVERIAASTQILRSMRPPGIRCFAATHDRELTKLLEEEYDNYYFTEEIGDGDIRFPYRLHAGSTDSRNAIRLLEAVGYDKDIVAKASAQAEQFLKEGCWR